MTPKKKLSDIVKDMAALKQQWANTKPAADTDKPIPPGEYVCALVEGNAGESGSGKAYYKITLRVASGEYAGRLVWHDFYLSPAALPYTMRAFSKIGVTDLEQLDDGLPPGLAVKAKIVVKTLDNASERNEVKSWVLAEVNADAKPGTPNAPAEPAPWAVDLGALDTDNAKGDGQ